MPKSTSQKLQICRAIAIIAVVCIHTCNNGYISLMVRPLLNFCVAAFLSISGLLANYETGKLKQFYKKRLLRVLVPYLIWSLVYTISYRSYESFPYNFLTGQCCGIYYYILVYIQLTLIIPLLNKLMLSPYWKLGFAISPIAIAIQYILTFLGHQLLFPWNANLCFVWLIYFYFGMCVRSGKFKISCIKLRFVIVAFLIQYVETAFWILVMNNTDMATTQIKISAMITSLVVICVGYNWATSNKALKENIAVKAFIHIGDISFGIYLTHILIMDYAGVLINRMIFPLNAIAVIILNIICIDLVRRLAGRRCSKWLGLN